MGTLAIILGNYKLGGPMHETLDFIFSILDK